MISHQDIQQFVATAKPGETIEYHRGLLSYDRDPAGHPNADDDDLKQACASISHRANLIWDLYAAGFVRLFQRAIDPATEPHGNKIGVYSYCMVMRA